jgi:hypothetical protein
MLRARCCPLISLKAITNHYNLKALGDSSRGDFDLLLIANRSAFLLIVICYAIVIYVFVCKRRYVMTDHSGARIPGTSTYAGLFLITLSTLMFEILLTRIFSVTMYYHFAFMAISIALFGMTLGALIVYLRPKVFVPEKAVYHMALNSLIFSVSLVCGFIVHLLVPFPLEFGLPGILSLTLTYIAIAVPFVFSGIVVCIALTKFPGAVSRLYAADLVGAALGCIVFKYVMDITDGPTAVVVTGVIAAAGAVAFLCGVEGRRKLMLPAVALLCIFTLYSGVNTFLVRDQKPLVRLPHAKGNKIGTPLFEKWNSYSRITVFGDTEKYIEPRLWGRSPRLSRAYPSKKIELTIDSSAATSITRFNGDHTLISFLEFDVVNMAHFIRRNADILIIGAGGGKDILSALLFDQRSITGVEINEDIVSTLNGPFGEFSGHLDRIDKVSFVIDEARSYITRTDRKYDIIQASLIDTWAATSAGAFVLTENSLYTMEAWKIFLDKLNPEGILTFSRWHVGGYPTEMYRLVSLATGSLEAAGISSPRDHIILVSNISLGDMKHYGIATILVSPAPFSPDDRKLIREKVERLGYHVLIDPDTTADNYLGMLAAGGGTTKEAMKASQLNLSPPTDNKPFFFHMLRLKDIFSVKANPGDPVGFNLKAVKILGILLIIVLVLTVLFIILPLALTTQKGSLKGSLPFFAFFASIGFGFILVEISMLQKLIVFLGHPTYSLTVVLFSLLVSSGIGSFYTSRIRAEERPGTALVHFSVLIVLLVVAGLVIVPLLNGFQAASTQARVLVSVMLLAPLGFFMGMAFPLGMRMAASGHERLTPWFWGINGSTSVCGSVLAMVIALELGISMSFWAGVVCYCAAIAAYAISSGMTGRAAAP